MSTKHRAWLLPALLLTGASTSSAATWLETRAAIEEFAESSDYAAAVGLSDEFLEQVRESYGDTSDQLVDSHLFVARIYNTKGEPLKAREHLLEAIAIRETIAGPNSAMLIEPHIRLGDTLFAAGEYELALVSYDEARMIGRREYGLLNLDQRAILDKMIVSAVALGEFDLASRYWESSVSVTGRNYGLDSSEYRRANYRYAQWLRMVGRFKDANRVFYQMQRVSARRVEPGR